MISTFFRAGLALVMAIAVTAVSAQTLGTYSNASVVAGRNTTVTPSAAPTSYTSVTVFSGPNFAGTLSVEPTTGIVRVTNARLAGSYLISVRAFNGANSVTRTFTLTVTNPPCTQGLFFGTNTAAVGASPNAIVVGDFNNDGQQDFASANTGANTVSIRLGDGAGNFTGSTNLSTGTSPTDVAVADFNLDGRQDLAVVNFGSSTVSIFLGNGSGGFTNSGNISVGPNPIRISIGDFNGDGRADFVTPNQGNTTAATASVRLGNGSGGFTNAPDITDFSFQQLPNASAVTDYNSDGIQDILISTNDPREVTFFTGNGSGGFTRITETSRRQFVGDGPVAIALGDFNNNGIVDFVTANFFAGTVSLRFGDGNGFVGNSIYDFPVGQSPQHVAVADVNGDGNQDILVTLGGTSSGSVMILRGNGTGTYSNTNSITISPLTSPVWIAPGDFNQDGRADLLLSNNSSTTPTVSVRMGGINEINVQGNSTSILDGDATPSLTDHTDFGTVASGFSRTFTIQNLGTTALAISSITSSNNQFAISGAPSSVAAGASATFQVTFNSTSGAAQNSTITIQSNDCDEATYDFVVTAALSPILGNYPNLSVNAANDTTLAPASPPTAARITATTDARFLGRFLVNPSTGVVRVLNPQPAGTYTVTVRAYSGTASVAKTFTLTVTAPICSNPGFTSTSAQNLTVTTSPTDIQLGDFNHDGFQDLLTSNGSGGAVLRLGTGLGTFETPSTITLGSGARSLALGDFNGDGNLDFLCLDLAGTVYVRLGNGLGGFTNAAQFNVGSSPQSITVADFNNDGLLDLATANSGAGTVSIGLGNGLGGFAAATAVTVGTTPRHIATADFNNDGFIDLAVANGGSSSVSIRLGNGSGGFTGTTEVAVGSSPFQVAVGDFNGDGFPDFASTSNANPSEMSVRLGNGLGGFTNMPNLAVGFSTTSLAVADFNADGKLDLAIGETVTNSIYIRTGDGAGNFAAATSTIVNSSPFALAVGDVNNDGVLDLANASSFALTGINVRLGVSTTIRVRGNNTQIVSGDITPSLADHTDFGGVNGSFARTFTIENPSASPLTISSITSSNAQFVVSSVPTTIAAGGSANFQVTATPSGSEAQLSTISIASNVCSGSVFTFRVTATALPQLGDYTNSTVIWGSSITIPPIVPPANQGTIKAYSNANFKGALSVNSTTAEVQISGAGQLGTYPITVVAANGIYTDTARFNLTVTKPGCGPGVFVGTTAVTVGALPNSVALGDFNRDGKQDLLTSDFQGGSVSIRMGDGLGGFSGTSSLTGLFQPRSMAVADFDGDGAEDLAVTWVGGISTYRGNGIGGFNAPTVNSDVSITNDIAAADFNRDGRVDLIITAVSTNGVEVLLGNGNGGFAAPVSTSIGAGASPTSLAVGDFNNDGLPDVAVANGGSGTVAILLGNGSSSFTAAASLTVGTSPNDIALADFNNDGQVDLAVANNGSGTVSIRLGVGNGTFTAAADLALGSNPISVEAGDFNGDGLTDLVTSNNTAGLLLIRFGTGTGTFTGTNSITMNQPYRTVIGNFNRDGFQDIATANFGAASISIRLGSGNQISLQGNSQSILDGATTTSSNNHTDFGLLADTLQRTFSIQNTGTAPLVIDSIRSSNPFFIIRNAPASVAAGATATFRVTYNFDGTGVQTSTIRVFNNNCQNGEYDFLVRAEKDNPPALGNYPASSLSAGNTIIIMPDAAPVGASRITAFTTNGFPGTLSVDSITGALRVIAANQLGTYTITIRARRGLLSSTKTCVLTVTNTLCSSGSFNGTTSIPAGNAPRDVVTGDFNQDGIPDLAVANYNSSSVSIRLGNGLGGFTGTDSILVAPNPTALAVADFNGDGKQDLAISIFSTPARSVSIRYGNGLGGFSGNTEVTINAGFSVAVVAADFNQDGNMDFASASSSNIVGIFIGNGVGGFTNPTNVNVGANTELRSIALGDFNNDGFPDLVAGLYQTNAVRILLNDGLGGFTANAPVAVGARPNAVVAADFNADGKIDIATANAQAFSVSVRLGDGLGGLSGTTEVTGLNAGVFDLGTGDFNGDGNLDIAVAINSNFNAVNVRFGNGAGQFTGQLSVPAGLRPYGIVIGDWNKDGRQDFATSNETGRTLSIRMGDAGGDNIWLGLSTDWNDPANWSAGVGPGICTRAVINAGVPNMPVITDPNASCGSLRINPGATVTVAPGVNLRITSN